MAAIHQQATDEAVEENSLPVDAQDIPLHPKWRYMLTLLAAFMINFMVGGILFGFGVYQALYESLHLDSDTPFAGATPAEIDLIGSLSSSLLTIGAPLAVGWAKTFNPQIVVCAGGLIFGIAHVLASFGQELWHFQLSQGLMAGIGACFAFLPSMTVTPTWFGKHRGLAMGIVSAGTGVGGLVWAPALTACIDRMGYRNTLRLSGCLAAVFICMSGSVLKWEPATAARMLSQDTRLEKKKKSFWRIPLPSRDMLRQRKFMAQALGAFFQSAAYYSPVFFTVSYAKSLGLSASDGANLTAINNACNALGKIGVGFVADRIGRLNSFFLTTLISAVATLVFWVWSTQLGANEAAARGLYITFTILWGLFASAFVSLFSPALVELFGMHDLPRVSGVMYMMQGTAALVGTPIAGVLISNHGVGKGPQDFLNMAILVGTLMAAATVAVGWMRLEAMRERTDGSGRRWIWRL
ncbi:hypothetical protein ACHAQH_000910 [Verticillium albo-atrum]